MKRLIHAIVGMHFWETRRSEWWELGKGQTAWEVYERCRFCHMPRDHSWRLEWLPAALVEEKAR